MFTPTDIVNEIRKLAAEQPDFVYATDEFISNPDPAACCLYTKNLDGSDGGCIVGQALMRLGVPARSLEAQDGSAADDVISSILGADTFTDELIWASHAQSSQDTGSTWSQAVASADEIMEARVIKDA